MIRFTRITVVLFILLSAGTVFAQKVNPLFQSEETLKITIKLPLKTVIKDIDKRVPQNATPQTPHGLQQMAR